MRSEQVTVLAVDDNEVHRYAMQRVLKLLGYNVLEAATARDALKLALEHNPDVVLMDVNLPDGNGIDVCRRLREQPFTGNIAVVLHTASSAMEVVQSSGERAGADGFLLYPIEREHLRTVITGALSRRARVPS